MEATQARHAVAMANKILNHLQRMQWAMEAIRDHSEPGVPVETIIAKFNELEPDWNQVQSVLSDMLPELEG